MSGLEPPFWRGPPIFVNWWHYWISLIVALVTGVLSVLFGLAVGLCEGVDCPTSKTPYWVSGLISIAFWLYAWVVAGALVKQRQEERKSSGDGPALGLILASIPPLLPVLAMAVASNDEYEDLSGNLESLEFVFAASAMVAVRLAWGMHRGYLKKNVVPIVLVFIPAILVIGLIHRQYVVSEREQHEFETYRPSPAERRFRLAGYLPRFGDLMLDQQRDSTERFGELLDLHDPRVLALTFQGKDAVPPHDELMLRYARSGDKRRAVFTSTVGKSEFVWTYEMTERGKLSLGAYCKGWPLCGGVNVPATGTFTDVRNDPRRCQGLEERPAAWCAKANADRATLVDDLPVNVTSLKSETAPLKAGAASKLRNDPEHPGRAPGGRFGWLIGFDDSLAFRQSAELWEHDRFADFHEGWRFDQLANEPPIIPTKAKLRYRIFSKNNRAIMVVDYKGSTFIWDFRSPARERWVAETYCRGRPMCGEIVPTLDGFAKRAGEHSGCERLTDSPDSWCASSAKSAWPHVRRLPRSVRSRLSRAKKIPDEFRQSPPPTEDVEANLDPSLEMSWLSVIVGAIRTQQWVAHGSDGFDSYSDLKTQRMMKGMSAWSSVPKGVEVRGDRTRNKKSALVLITSGRSEFLVDFETRYGDSGLRVFCRGAPGCGLAVPNYTNYEIKSKRGRDCRAARSKRGLWCAYDYEEHSVVVMRLPKELRSRYQRLKRR